MSKSKATETQRQAYSVEDACTQCGGIGKVKFYELLASGELKSFKIGRRRFVSAQAIAEFIAKREQALA